MKQFIYIIRIYDRKRILQTFNYALHNTQLQSSHNLSFSLSPWPFFPFSLYFFIHSNITNCLLRSTATRRDVFIPPTHNFTGIWLCLSFIFSVAIHLPHFRCSPATGCLLPSTQVTNKQKNKNGFEWSQHHTSQLSAPYFNSILYRGNYSYAMRRMGWNGIKKKP